MAIIISPQPRRNSSKVFRNPEANSYGCFPNGVGMATADGIFALTGASSRAIAVKTAGAV
ncbi:MAG: hypothetical protein LBL24_06750 [Bacteroidales bacterium]|nr:hypothetical protein [Bacteroidales bacterium]